MLPSDERDLVLRVLHGDRQAFDQIVLLHQQSVFALAWRLLGETHEAEDAAQEVFLRAYRFLDTFDLDRPLAPWLHRITMNICLNRLHTAKPATSLDDVDVADGAPGPERQAVDQDRQRRVQFELDRLPARYRLVIILRHFDQMTYEEIAQALGRPLSDIKSDLFRARKLLSERLGDLR